MYRYFSPQKLIKIAKFEKHQKCLNFRHLILYSAIYSKEKEMAYLYVA